MRREEAEAVCKECEAAYPWMRWEAEEEEADWGEEGQAKRAAGGGRGKTWAVWGSSRDGSYQTASVTGPTSAYGRWRAEARRSGGRGNVEVVHQCWEDTAMDAMRKAAELFGGMWEDDGKWRESVRAELELQASRHRMELSIIEAALGDLDGSGDEGEESEGEGNEALGGDDHG